VDVATDALFAQCGVIRMDTVAGLFDAAMAFSSGPLPSGPNVAIVTNAGGPGIIIADACEATGLEVAPLSEESQARLRSGLPAEASVVNPVDMIASARAEDYRKALEVVLEDPKVDAVIAAFVPPLGIDQVEITRAIRDVAAERRKPVMAVLMGREGLPQGMAELREAKIPAYIFPESAARALAATYRYRRWLDRPAGEVVSFDVDVEKAGELLSATRLAGHEMVPLDVALEVLNAYGIPVAAHRVVKTVDEAVQAAGELEYPVVLKAISPALVHKTEQGGVAVDIETEEGLRAAFERMESDVGEADGTRPRYLVQEMLPGGKEVIVGMSLEPNFGPLLMFGLGGIYVEAIGDIVFRAHPVSDVDASDMVRSVRGLPLLEGVRGEPGVDLRTLSEVIQRTSQLIGTHEEIVELDINPFLAFPEPDRCVAVDARIRLTRP
jgi:acetyltransferase